MNFLRKHIYNIIDYIGQIVMGAGVAMMLCFCVLMIAEFSTLHTLEKQCYGIASIMPCALMAFLCSYAAFPSFREILEHGFKKEQ